MKLTNEEAINLAKVLVKYCENRSCTSCAFYKNSVEHYCTINLPYKWGNY